jgi:hypothetical protein
LRMGASISDADYKSFVQPYEADKVLDNIRRSREK